MATVSETHPPLRRRLVRAVSMASLIGVVVGVGLALAVTVGRSPARSASAPSEPRPAATVPVSPSATAPVSETDAASLGEASDVRPAPEGTPAKKVAPRVHPRTSGCSPAYTIDARGVRHYKPECL